MFNKKPNAIINGKYIRLVIYNSFPSNIIRVFVSKKDIKKAVLRNRIKRIILANVRLIKKEQKQFLFKIKPEINNVPKKELNLVLKKEISRILNNY
jgi:ribonuclease P protein component